MQTAEEFLAAIEARPADASLRAVFCDWLMDLGDVRGELIAEEESVRGLAPTSDAYWKGKAKRDALRQAVRAMIDGPAFLRILGYGDRYEPVLQHPHNGWRDRWRLIRDLTTRWFGVALPDVSTVPPPTTYLTRCRARGDISSLKSELRCIFAPVRVDDQVQAAAHRSRANARYHSVLSKDRSSAWPSTTVIFHRVPSLMT